MLWSLRLLLLLFINKFFKVGFENSSSLIANKDQLFNVKTKN